MEAVAERQEAFAASEAGTRSVMTAAIRDVHEETQQAARELHECRRQLGFTASLVRHTLLADEWMLARQQQRVGDAERLEQALRGMGVFLDERHCLFNGPGGIGNCVGVEDYNRRLQVACRAHERASSGSGPS